MRPVQYFSDEYLESVRGLSATEIAHFIDEFQRIQEQPSRSILISIKVPEPLLRAFKGKCALRKIPYQTEIKRLMKESL